MAYVDGALYWSDGQLIFVPDKDTTVLLYWVDGKPIEIITTGPQTFIGPWPSFRPGQ